MKAQAPFDHTIGLRAARLIHSAATNAASEKAAEKSEKESQDKFAQFLSLHEYEYVRPPMHRRSALPLGWPDFTFCTKRGRGVAIEIKAPCEKPQPHQTARHIAMEQAGWSVAVCYSAAEAIAIVRKLEGQP